MIDSYAVATAGVSESRRDQSIAAAERRLSQHLLRAAEALRITALAASGDLGFQGCQKKASALSDRQARRGDRGWRLLLGDPRLVESADSASRRSRSARD